MAIYKPAIRAEGGQYTGRQLVMQINADDSEQYSYECRQLNDVTKPSISQGFNSTQDTAISHTSDTVCSNRFIY
jgi:hypothetical protein